MRAIFPWPMRSPTFSATPHMSGGILPLHAESESKEQGRSRTAVSKYRLHERTEIQGSIGLSLRRLAGLSGHAPEQKSQGGSHKRGHPRFLRGSPLFDRGLPQNISQYSHFLEDYPLSFRGPSRSVFRRPHFCGEQPRRLRGHSHFVGDCPLFIWGSPLFSDFQSRGPLCSQGSPHSPLCGPGRLSQARAGHRKPQTPILCAHLLGEASIRIPSRRANLTASTTRICAGRHPAMRLSQVIQASCPTLFQAVHPQNPKLK